MCLTLNQPASPFWTSQTYEMCLTGLYLLYNLLYRALATKLWDPDIILSILCNQNKKNMSLLNLLN